MTYFEVRQRYAPEDFAALNFVTLRRETANIKFLPILFIILVFLTITNTLPTVQETDEITLIAHAIFILMFVIAAIILILFGNRILAAGMGKLAWKNYQYRDMDILYTFGDNQFYNGCAVSEARSRYDIITHIAEDRERFFLFAGKNMAHMIRKDCFTLGSPEQFRDFIQQNTGKPVQFII